MPNVGLASTNGTPIALQSVHVEGQADGLLASMSIRQRYCNQSGAKLEVVYTFPLAYGAVLLGMDVTLGGRRLHGAVVKKIEASERYEKALEEGDTPVLAEQSAPGLYTVNLGNIEPGEELLVEFRYAQLLCFDNGQLRLAIPCVIAERYGHEHLHGGLARHQSAAPSTLAEYPFSLHILLRGQLAGGKVSCPSHACLITDMVHGKAVSLQSGLLDRDFVLCVRRMGEVEQQAFALSGKDVDDQYLMLAGFSPSLSEDEAKAAPKPEPQRVWLKILLDCSGSMDGDSMDNARKGLFGLLGLLERGDAVSFSRFGDVVRHETDLLPWSFHTMAQLGQIINELDADMGGTRMEKALLATLGKPLPEGEGVPPCVLLISDGAVWDVDRIVQAGLSGKQRIFAIGVGSAPAESLLQDLARKTGGACALVSPHESIIDTMCAMVAKMREVPATALRVDWGAEPLWQSTLPLHVYAGETVHVFAAYTKPPVAAPRFHWRMGVEERSFTATPGSAWDEALTRLAGATRTAAARGLEEAQKLALQYQLVGPYTSLLLVHEREGEKSVGLPRLQQVPHMRAAGHHGFGTVRYFIHDPGEKQGFFDSIKNSRTGLGVGPRTVTPDTVDVENTTLLLRSIFSPRPEKKPALTPLELLQRINARTWQGEDMLQLLHFVSHKLHNTEPGRALAVISHETELPDDLVHVLFLEWLLDKCREAFTPSADTTDVLRQLRKYLTGRRHSNVEVAIVLIENAFTTVTPDLWNQLN